MASWCRRTLRLPRCRTIVPTISNRKQRAAHMNEGCGLGERPYCGAEASPQSGALSPPPHNFPAGALLSSLVSCAACVHHHLLTHELFPTQRNASALFLNSQAERGLPPSVALDLVELDSK